MRDRLLRQTGPMIKVTSPFAARPFARAALPYASAGALSGVPGGPGAIPDLGPDLGPDMGAGPAASLLPASPAVPRKAVGLVLGLALSALFLWLVFRSIPLDDFRAAVGRADARWVLAAVGAFGLAFACRIWRWRLMLACHNPDLGWARCSVPFMTSIAANNVLPFRAGDVLRGVAFSRWLGVPTARVLATLLVERLLDLLSLIVALAFALGIAATLVPTGPAGLHALSGASAGILALVACAVALVLLLPGLFEPPVLWLLRQLAGRAPGLTDRLRPQVAHVFQTLATLSDRARMLRLMGWSLLAWTFEACVFYAIARALPDITAPMAAWVAMPVGTLSTMLPSTPGYIGTFHYFVMQTAQAFGNPELAAVAFAVLVHLALYIPATLWGGACFVCWMISGRIGRQPGARPDVQPAVHPTVHPTAGPTDCPAKPPTEGPTR